MEYYSEHISKLISELGRLPGIGTKSAQRLAFFIINQPKEQVEKLTETMLSARNNVKYCRTCFTLIRRGASSLLSDATLGSSQLVFSFSTFLAFTVVKKMVRC